MVQVQMSEVDMARGDKQLLIRLPEGLREALQELADKNRRSVNAEVIASIELALSVHSGSEEVVTEASKVIGGMGHSVKLMKPDAIENFINVVAKSAAEAAIKELKKDSVSKSHSSDAKEKK